MLKSYYYNNNNNKIENESENQTEAKEEAKKKNKQSNKQTYDNKRRAFSIRKSKERKEKECFACIAKRAAEKRGLREKE